MWKDFFYFSRGQRTGIMILLALIVIVMIMNYSMPYFFPVTQNNNTAFLANVDDFKKSLLSHDSLRLADWQKQSQERQRQYQEKYNKYPSYPTYKTTEKKDSYTLFPFDPNTIDSTSFVRLGLKPFIASNILKYRNKGGHFRTSADFSKVYGILPAKFKELQPFISIENKKLVNPDSISGSHKEFNKDLIVDLNSADTILLMQVKGIGRSYANGIVRFRQTMGGFTSVGQLSELYGMRPESFEKIRLFCSANQALVRKIKINSATVERLNVHPYINFYQAKAIYELRRYKGKLTGMNDLKELSEFNKESLAKIQPYLSFE